MIRLSPSKRPSLRPVAITVALLAVTAVSASCSSGGTPPPQVYVTSTLGSPPSGMSMCPYNQPQLPFVTIGTGSSGSPGPVAAGGAIESITCQVQGSGPFDVALNVQTSSGSVSVSGTIANTTSPQTVRASFDSMDGTYGESNCTVSFNSGTPEGVFPGKIWGNLLCPTMTPPGQTADGGAGTAVCYGTAEFLFQYCNE